MADQFLGQPGGVGPGAVKRAVEVHGGGAVGVVAGGDLQARGQLVGSGRGPPLPGPDDGGGVCVRPCQMHVGGGLRRGHGPEDKRRHDAEVAGAGAAERPEQVRLVVVVALEDAAVGEHDLRPDEVVGGDAVLPSEDPEAAAQGQPRHPDRRAGAAGDREVVVLQGLVDLAEARAGAHRGHAFGDRHRPHRRDVHEQAPGRGVGREAVPAGAGRELQAVPASERDRLCGVLGAGAGHDGRRPDVTEPGVERRGRCLVGGEPRSATSPSILRRSDSQSGSSGFISVALLILVRWRSVDCRREPAPGGADSHRR